MKKVISIFISLFLIAVAAVSVSAYSAHYTDMNVPAASSFKSWMDWRAITNTRSPQYKLLRTWCYHDSAGFMRAAGEDDLGITDDYYVVALGSYYGSKIGTKYKITLDSGKYFYAILGDQKANKDTNSTHQYGARNKDIVECLVDTRYLISIVKQMGSADYHTPLKGKIIKIQRIDFY